MSVTVTLTGVEAHHIRRYESCGLLQPWRTSGRQRLFSDLEIEIIKEASRLANRGINLEGIKAIYEMKRGKRV
jgi:DNA-binding transcriptional MerR regulator